MASFKTHITASTTLGVGYALWGVYRGESLEAACVAGGLCGAAGMLPDIDSPSGVPLRELMGLAAALAPMLMLDRLIELGLDYEQLVLAAGAIYLFVRLGVMRLVARYTVHRGMLHSLPALLIFTGLAFLICGSTDLSARYYRAGAVFVGVLSHLLLDEMYAVEWRGGRWRFKRSFGSAIKLWSPNLWANCSTYLKLAAVVVLILSEPAIMERYGRLSPLVVNNDYWRSRLREAALAGEPPDATVDRPASTTDVATGASPGHPVATSPLGSGPAAQSPRDRTIYDTARRLWQRWKG
jgi:membrane-bound metal-dependent hydrolase YbcI (DUF457 family)